MRDSTPARPARHYWSGRQSPRRRPSGWADGRLTVSGPPNEQLAVVDAFRRGGGAGKPMYLKVQLSYAEDDRAAREGAFDQWRTNIFPSHVLGDVSTPA